MKKPSAALRSAREKEASRGVLRMGNPTPGTKRTTPTRPITPEKAKDESKFRTREGATPVEKGRALSQGGNRPGRYGFSGQGVRNPPVAEAVGGRSGQIKKQKRGR